MNYSDPFGLRVQIGCRPIGGALGAMYSHCAIRIDDSYGHHYSFELMPVKVPGEPDTWNTIQSVPDEDEYTWTTVGAPEGMKDDEWDSTVRAAAEVVGYRMSGKKYHADGARNSNHYVHEAITTAGGNVPESAKPKDGRKAPGLCGGSGASTGECKP